MLWHAMIIVHRFRTTIARVQDESFEVQEVHVWKEYPITGGTWKGKGSELWITLAHQRDMLDIWKAG